MKVLIVGSLRNPDAGNSQNKPTKQFVKDNTEKFQAACNSLGKALAERDHSVWVGVPDWPSLKRLETVASFVVKGISRAPVATGSPEHSITFYGPREPEPGDSTLTIDSLEEFRALPNIKIKRKFVGRKASKARTIPNVAEVDCVILVSGQEGTESIGYAAYSMEKPTFAITYFDGAARSIAEDVLTVRYDQYSEKGGIEPEDLEAFDVDWTGDQEELDRKAKSIVVTMEKLVKAYYRSHKEVTTFLWEASASLPVLLFLWLSIFFRCSSKSACGAYVNLAFFGLLYASALIGAGLRTLSAYQGNRITKLTHLGSGIDAGISLVVAFGLALIYLIGGITFTGSVIVLPSTDTAANSTSGNTFASIAISMSLLGLAAGYLVPLSNLEEYLRKIVTQEKK